MNNIPETMRGVHLTGLGGFEKLDYRTDIAVPAPASGEVLIKIGAAAVNNTDVNTRIGWYSKKVNAGTNTGGAYGFDDEAEGDGTWLGQAMARGSARRWNFQEYRVRGGRRQPGPVR